MESPEKNGKGFRELIVWQKSMRLVSRIYQATSEFPLRERFGLVSQMRRAAVSIPANIAEGQARIGQRQFRHFLGISKGSLAELETEIQVAQDLRYLTGTMTLDLLKHCAEIGRLLNGLIRSLNKLDNS